MVFLVVSCDYVVEYKGCLSEEYVGQVIRRKYALLTCLLQHILVFLLAMWRKSDV